MKRISPEEPSTPCRKSQGRWWKKNHQTVDSAKVKPLKCYSSQMWRKNIIRNAWGGRAMLIKFLFRWISLLNIRSLAVATTKPFCSTWADFSGVRYAGRWNKKKVQSFPRDCSRFHSKTMIFSGSRGQTFLFVSCPSLNIWKQKLPCFDRGNFRFEITSRLKKLTAELVQMLKQLFSLAPNDRS